MALVPGCDGMLAVITDESESLSHFASGYNRQVLAGL
jgi:hypothetical protein